MRILTKHGAVQLQRFTVLGIKMNQGSLQRYGSPHKFCKTNCDELSNWAVFTPAAVRRANVVSSLTSCRRSESGNMLHHHECFGSLMDHEFRIVKMNNTNIMYYNVKHDLNQKIYEHLIILWCLHCFAIINLFLFLPWLPETSWPAISSWIPLSSSCLSFRSFGSVLFCPSNWQTLHVLNDRRWKTLVDACRITKVECTMYSLYTLLT